MSNLSQSQSSNDWNTLSVSVAPLKVLKPAFQAVLVTLQFVQSVLEKVLDLLKALAVFLTNPLTAVFALLLASIRLIINQLKATGLSMLVVTPDFNRGSMPAILASVSGAYPGFEKKVVKKFHDSADIFRPSYPDGSSVAMVVFYIGVDSPGDLIGQINALMAFFRDRNITPGTLLPAPVNLKVSTIAKSDDPLAVTVDATTKLVNFFKDISSADYQPALMLQWSMPDSPGAANAPGFLNPLISLYSSYKFPHFIIERSELPTGKQLTTKVQSETGGSDIEQKQKDFGVPSNSAEQIIRDSDGRTVFRFFDSRRRMDTSTNILGFLSNTYEFKDDTVEAGKKYFYRVRAFYGSPDTYLDASESDFNSDNSGLIRIDQNRPFVFYGNGVTMGRPSSVVKGYAPFPLGGGWNPYVDLYNATMVGVLLNFDLPPSSVTDSPAIKDKKTGWGTLSLIGGVIATYKAVLKNSNSLKNSKLVKAAVRKLTNAVLNGIITNVKTNNDLKSQYNVLRSKVEATLNTDVTWTFPTYSIGDLNGGMSASTAVVINNYLLQESKYVDGATTLDGPYPLVSWQAQDVSNFSVSERTLLAAFLNSAYSGLGVVTGYLHWYSVTLGDLFPAFISFIYDLEQFISAVLKAYKNILEDIIKTVENVINKIKQLEKAVRAIIALIDLLSVSLRVSVLGYASASGSADGLADALVSSTNKPSSNPYGLHSGLVLTVGGPGEGIIDTVKALGYVLGINIGT
jgi:hypothetical protein